MRYASNAVKTAVALATLALSAGFLSAPADAVGFWTPPASPVETDSSVAHREASCNHAKMAYFEAVQHEQASNHAYVLNDHPEMKRLLVRAYPDCLAAVVSDATNPNYNLSIGTMMLVLSDGFGPNDVHLHGIAYVQNAAAYGYRLGDPFVEARACAVATAFALDGEFRCSQTNIQQANDQADARFASLDPSRQRMLRQDDEYLQLLIAGR